MPKLERQVAVLELLLEITQEDYFTSAFHAQLADKKPIRSISSILVYIC